MVRIIEFQFYPKDLVLKECISMGIKYQKNKLYVLDQQMLPNKEIWVSAKTPEEMSKIIVQLKTRGAPLIGVAAALSLGDYAEKEKPSFEHFSQACDLLEASRPTAINLMWAVDKMRSIAKESQMNTEQITQMAEAIFEEDVELCQKMAKNGSHLFEEGDHILTHCNTGGLATAGIGTALGVIVQSHLEQKNIHVYVDETRPLLQGGRLTTWELKKHQVPYTLISDNMAGHLMSLGKIKKVILGSDRIAMNGDFANKIGTYSVAVLAKHHNIPFYVAAPYSTVDPKCFSGTDIPIEQRKAEEVRGVLGAFGEICWAPEDAKVYNPAFDVTPAELVTGYVLDRGYVPREQIADFLKENMD